ncbi:hypothetical protein [Micromonospora sp. NPDC047730]|uniref:hypothetical protein n=1 Tax=unclassified Micromonospora TaxID=2617518 RepID=UPI00371977B1
MAPRLYRAPSDLTRYARVDHISPTPLARRDALTSAISATVPSLRIQGGIHLWVCLPEGADTREFCATAYQAGVLAGDGRHFLVDEPPAPFIRFSYGAAAESQIVEGVRRLAELGAV